MQIAIHQPNYLPWLGYFHKVSRAGRFVLLDDVQFPKQSYTNRVQIAAGPAQAGWLTIPVAVSLGQRINQVHPAQADWPRRHLDRLANSYRRAAHAGPVLADLARWLDGIDCAADLATINGALIERIAAALGLATVFVRSSAVPIEAAVAADDRLVALVAALDPGGAYLSGKGGAKYQDPAKFAAAGLGFAYLDYAAPAYPRGDEPPLAGLSAIDAACHLGWAGAATLVRGAAP